MVLSVVLRPRARSVRLGAGKPSVVTIVLGVVLGVAQLVNQLVLTGSGELVWRDVIAVGISFLAGIGIQPLFGPALATLLHIPAKVLLAASVALTSLTALLTILPMSVALHAVFATVLTLVSGLVLGAPVAALPTPVPAPPVPAPVPPAPGPPKG